MLFIFTFLLVATLEPTVKNDKTEEPAKTEKPDEPDMCVGCDDKEKEKKQVDNQLKIDIVVDPITGKIQYIIKDIPVQ
mgnify:CR=1 FL=1|tara:strand:+ start:1009 stop:1242 length:234 start_codon:yes stop_codon:yes gene_type:complete